MRVCDNKRTPLEESKDSAFCVACANPSCSEECHNDFYVHEKACHFHKNFDEWKPNKSIRSLTFNNIRYAEEKDFPVGTILNKSSSSYLMGLKHAKKDWVYLQRGYKDYGRVDVG